MRAPPNKWSPGEHQLFIEGLAKLGRGNWKAISQHFVKTRTSTQIASHAQKHFARLEKRKKHLRLRASIFDDDDDGVVNVDGDEDALPPASPATNSTTAASIPRETGTEVCSPQPLVDHCIQNLLYNIFLYREYQRRRFFTAPVYRPVPIRRQANNHVAWVRDLLR